MRKTRITTYTLLLLLSLSLFTTMSVLPAQAIDVPLLDIPQLKEYKQWSSYNPSYTFSKQGGGGVLQMMSNDAGFGDAYVFWHINKNLLHGNKLRVYWRWYLDWSSTSYTLAYVYVVNNVHNRKLEGEGEFSTYNDQEHPVTDYTYITACSLTATCNGGWIDWTLSPPSNVLNLNGWNSVVTIMIKIMDPWIQDTVGLQVDYFQILDSNNNVLRQYTFDGQVCMDKTSASTYYDYGLMRNPSSALYGTRNYAGMSAPQGECDASQGVSAAIYDFFADTGKYTGYLYDYFGDYTEQYYAYAFTETGEDERDYSAVFYKGHIWPLGYGDCGVGGCTYFHNGMYDDEGTVEADSISDFGIDATVRGSISENSKLPGTHDFIFIWACGFANESYVGPFNEAHSAGLLASWMHLDPFTLNTDAYTAAGCDDPDYSDHVFISFVWFSIWYRTTAYDDWNYGHWAYYFYESLLNYGYTVEAALDRASELTHNGDNFGDCPLTEGYPLYGYAGTSRMRIWGDVSHRLPR